MMKLVSKFASDILPSVVATIIGAYIVNHYIATKPGAEAPVTASASTSDPKTSDLKTSDSKLSETKKTQRKTEKPVELSSDVTNIPEAGVKAKGISEKAVFEAQPMDSTQADKPAAEKLVEKPSETASLPSSGAPVETRSHTPVAREKTAIRTIPLTAQPVTPAAAPVAAPAATPSVEASIAPEEHRDANDLARAAIERLRGSSGSSPRVTDTAHPQETARVPEAPRVAATPVVAAPVTAPVVSTPMRPLPPPIVVATPSADSLGQPVPQARPSYSTPSYSTSYSTSARMDDPSRPIPPADIPSAAPSSGPLDLRADAATLPLSRARTAVGAVGDDMLSAAKSVFHAVIPQQQ